MRSPRTPPSATISSNSSKPRIGRTHMGGVHILDAAGYAIYAALGITALYGIYGVLVLARRIAQKRFGSSAAAEQFLDEVRDRLSRRDFDGVSALCDTPGYWSKAVPQLILVA